MKSDCMLHVVSRRVDLQARWWVILETGLLVIFCRISIMDRNNVLSFPCLQKCVILFAKNIFSSKNMKVRVAYNYEVYK